MISDPMSIAITKHILTAVAIGNIKVEGAAVLLGWTRDEVELGVHIVKFEEHIEPVFSFSKLRDMVLDETKKPINS